MDISRQVWAPVHNLHVESRIVQLAGNHGTGQTTAYNQVVQRHGILEGASTRQHNWHCRYQDLDVEPIRPGDHVFNVVLGHVHYVIVA